MINAVNAKTWLV